MKSNNVLLDCDVCEAPVVLKTGPGRRYEFRHGFFIDIPEDFPTATCIECGSVYLTVSEAVQLEERLRVVK